MFISKIVPLVRSKIYRVISPRAIILIFDLFLAAMSVVIGFWLKQANFNSIFWKTTLTYAGINGVTLCIMQMNKAMWRYFSLKDLVKLIKCAVISEALFAPFLVATRGQVSTSLLIVHFIVVLFLWAGVRLIYRYVYEEIALNGRLVTGKNVVIVGTGRQADLFIRESREGVSHTVVGILEASNACKKRQIHGIDVVGHIEDFEIIKEKLLSKNIIFSGVIIADKDIRGDKLSAIVRVAQRDDIAVEIVSSSFISGEIEVRPLSMKDLIGRTQVDISMDSVFPILEGKRVLITGAGGSIGSELMRQVCKFRPSHISILDNCEYALYKSTMELAEIAGNISKRSLLIDIRQTEKLRRIMAEEKPDIVFHAAALKHVPIVEEHPLEGIETNLMATVNLCDICVELSVSAMVFISTDKAVYPESVLGLTKRIGEIYCQAMDRKSGGTRFVSVRFGNVLESAGSVIPLFRNQIKNKKPITVTHPDVARYFMTLNESVALVLKAVALGFLDRYGRSNVFILKMGKLIKIKDIAENMICFYGMRPYKDVPIHFIGLRPGEKMNESLYEDNEHPVESENSDILYVGSNTHVNSRFLRKRIDQIGFYASENRSFDAINAMKEIIFYKKIKKVS